MLTPRWTTSRTARRLDAATHRADVWVNDTSLGNHEGGYTPFEFDITSFVGSGSGGSGNGERSLRITVRVDNRLTMHSMPPGIVDTDAESHRRQGYFHDFLNYAGLSR